MEHTQIEQSMNEKLDKFFQQLSLDKKEEESVETTSILKSSIENLLVEYENIKDVEESVEPTENIISSYVTTNPKELRRQKLRQIYTALAHEKEEIGSDTLLRVVKIYLRCGNLVEITTFLIETEKYDAILQIFSLPQLLESDEYENCLFNLADYFAKSQTKYETIFKLLQCAVVSNIYTLFPFFSLCLRKLAKMGKIEECMALINYIVYYKVEVSTCALNYLIEVLCRQNKFSIAQDLVSRFRGYQAENVFPEDKLDFARFSKLNLHNGANIVTYGTLIKGLCRSGNVDLALYHYKSLLDQDLIEDEIIFNLLIDGCSKGNNLEQIRQLYYDMLHLRITPTIVTFNTIIDAYIRARDLESAWKIYDDLVQNRIKPDNFTFSTLFRGIRNQNHNEFLYRSFLIMEDLKSRQESIDIILINVLLDSCISLKEDRLIVDLFEKVRSGYFSPVSMDIITFNTFIKGCAQMNLFSCAHDAFQHMLSQKCVKPNDVTFNTMIDVCVRSNSMPQVWSIIETMKEFGIKPDNFTYSTIIKGLNKNTNLNITKGDDDAYEEKSNTSELDLAFKLFENVKMFSKPDEILYNCIMDACLRFDKIDKMMSLYDEMIIEKIRPSSITCGIIIKAYGMKGKLSRALEVYEEMKRENIEISSVTYGCLINACIKNDNLPKAFDLYEELATNKIPMNTVLYTTLIKAYSKTKNLVKVLDIFNKMKRDRNNTPNNVTFNSVIDCCIKCDQLILAERMFEEMKLSGIKPDIVTFSTLIKGCLKSAELNMAIEYLNTMQKFEIKPDEVLLNSLLDGCDKIRNYKKAVEIFKYIRSFGIEPTMMSYSIMMKVYGKLNDYASSKQLIEEVKKKNKNISLIIFTCYMKTCFSTNNVDEAISIYRELTRFKLTPDSITFSTMLVGLFSYNLSDNSAIAPLIVEILKSSLEKNIMMNSKIYSDALNKLNNAEDNLASELRQLYISYDIDVSFSYGKPSNHYNKGDRNMNYLLDGYKHKQSSNYPQKRPQKTNFDAKKPLLNYEQNYSNIPTTTNFATSHKVYSNFSTTNPLKTALKNITDKGPQKISTSFSNFNNDFRNLNITEPTQSTFKGEGKPTKKFNRF